MKNNKTMIVVIILAIILIIAFNAISKSLIKAEPTKIQGEGVLIESEGVSLAMLGVLNQYVGANNTFVTGENVKSIINLIDNRYANEFGPDVSNHLKSVNTVVIESYKLKNVYMEYKTTDCVVYKVEYEANNQLDYIYVVVYENKFSIFLKDISLDKIVSGLSKGNEYIGNGYSVLNSSVGRVSVYYSYFLTTYKANKENSLKFIDEDYYNSKFGDIDEFSKYIDDYFGTARAVSIVDEFKKDGKNYYTFTYGGEKRVVLIEDKLMSFKIRFDEYTTLPEKYDSLSNKEKAEYVKDLFCEMVKNKDYETIYEHLDETFKNNNYSNYEDLVSLFESIEIDRKHIESMKVTNKISQIYTYNLGVFGDDVENEGAYLLDLIIKIENSDYKWSFSIVKVDNIE